MQTFPIDMFHKPKIIFSAVFHYHGIPPKSSEQFIASFQSWKAQGHLGSAIHVALFNIMLLMNFVWTGDVSLALA